MPSGKTVPGSDDPADVAQRKHGVAGVFSRAAPTYDRVGPRFFSHFGRRLVELAQIPREARVLDVATGKGAVLFPAAEAVGPSGYVTGVDLSDAMVQETAGEIHRLGLAHVEARQMDAERLTFPDASFDWVLCGFALFFFPQLDRALSEMHRVLRPNGRIAVTTWDRSFDAQWQWFDDLVKAHLPPDVDAEQSSEPLSPQPPVLDTVEGLGSVMETAGFVDIRVVSETAEIVYASGQELWAALWSHGMRASLERVEEATGPDGLDRFRDAVLTWAQTIRQADGIHQVYPALFALAARPR